MKDGQKQYRILRIDEPDFGCEGRDDGEAAYDEITLVNEQGETCLVRMEEQQVWSMGLDEGMLAWVGKDGQIRGRCKSGHQPLVGKISGARTDRAGCGSHL